MKRHTQIFFLIISCLIASYGVDAQTDSAALDSAQYQLSNDPVLINNIYIVGNKKTKPRIILRELSLDEGEYVPGSSLDQILEQDRNLIYNTNLFSTVEIEKLQLDSATYDLLIKVKERWYFYPVPVFKLTDRNFNDWWVNRNRDLSRVKYGLRLHKYNFRGLNERLLLVALFGFENQFIFGYRMPYIEKTQRHGLEWKVGYKEQNNLAYQTDDHLPTFITSRSQKQEVYSGELTHSFRNNYYNYLRNTLVYYKVNIADTIATLNPNYLGNGATSQQAFILRQSFTRDLRDNRNYALNGYLLFLSAEKVGLGIFNDVDIWRFTGYYDRTSDLGNGWYTKNSIAGQVSTEDQVSYFNYIGFGYLNYLVRGYELDVIEGYQNVLSKNEVRKLIFKGTSNISKVMPLEQFQKIPFAFYGKIFLDGGWINNYPEYEQNNRLSNQFLYGVGLGLDIVTLYDFTIRLEYSYNAENETNFFVNFTADL